MATGESLAPNFYAVLGLNGGECQSDIRKAYLAGCRKYHPDKNKDNALNDDFNLFVTAYNTLYNPHLRAFYDANLGTQNPKEKAKATITIEGNEHFRKMEFARRVLRKGARKVSSNKSKIEKQFSLDSGSLRFDEGVPCDGESCSQKPHTLYRVTDPKLIGSQENFVFVCLKHKYLHFCSSDCNTIRDICPIYAWYLVGRWHRHNNTKLEAQIVKKRKFTCTKTTCSPKPGDKTKGFARLSESIYTCKQHLQLHICENNNNLCEFVEEMIAGMPGHMICWATRKQKYSSHYEITARNPVPQQGAITSKINFAGRLRVLADGTSTFVPWGLDTGESIPELEESDFAVKARNNLSALNFAKERRLQQEDEDAECDTVVSADQSIYSRYIGVLGKETLDLDHLGDYLTMHHGRMGGDEGGTGFEGMEDDVEDIEREKEEKEDALVDYLRSERFTNQNLDFKQKAASLPSTS